jgi:predicted metal-dependent enzyme (double-stranded beta helix superfamily)
VPPHAPVLRQSRLTNAHRKDRWLSSLVDGLAHWATQVPEPALVERQSELLVATDIYEAWLLRWPPGGVLELHDHGGASGAFRVVSGILTESRTRHGATTPPAVEDLGPGRRRLFGPHDIHDVANRGTGPATSVHIYTPRLTSMTFYEADSQGVPSPVRTEHLVEAADLHPRAGWAWKSSA